MTIRHHPSDMVLAELAAGTLDEGSAMVVATHVNLCPICRRTVRRLEAVGGALLDNLAPTPLKAATRDAVFARLDQSQIVGGAKAGVNGAKGLPAPLATHKLGRWRWVGRGVYWRSVDLSRPGDTRVFMLKAGPGTRLPRHRHQDREWTCVLQGAFTHAGGTYAAGDFDEADESVEHHPSVDLGETCVCLVAMRGGIELQGFVGRLLQPLVRL
jgi:putative transcriptional regulator